MKNSLSVLSCIVKKTREGCDRDSNVGTVHSGQDGEEPVPPRKPFSNIVLSVGSMINYPNFFLSI